MQPNDYIVIAEHATDLLADEYAMHGFSDPPVINAAMVRICVSAFNRYVSARGKAAKPKQQAAKPQAQPATHQKYVSDAEEFLGRVREVANQLAVEGHMPSMSYWDKFRPDDLPCLSYVWEKTGMKGQELADACGLTYSPRFWMSYTQLVNRGLAPHPRQITAVRTHGVQENGAGEDDEDEDEETKREAVRAEALRLANAIAREEGLPVIHDRTISTDYPNEDGTITRRTRVYHQLR